MGDEGSKVYKRAEYKDIPYIIICEQSFHWTLIAEGEEVTTSVSPRGVREKFEALVDTGYFEHRRGE